MVKFTLPLVALAMAATSVVAGTTFSFEKWVEDIIANPDTALTVDEALAAAREADVVGSVSLHKRVNCERDDKRAPVCPVPCPPLTLRSYPLPVLSRTYETNMFAHGSIHLYRDGLLRPASTILPA